MRRIFKYRVPVGPPVEIRMPAESWLLHVAMQDGVPTIWLQVVEDDRFVVRRLVALGTGNEVPDGANFVGTAVGPVFVWHVYELEPLLRPLRGK